MRPKILVWKSTTQSQAAIFLRCDYQEYYEIEESTFEQYRRDLKAALPSSSLQSRPCHQFHR